MLRNQILVFRGGVTVTAMLTSEQFEMSDPTHNVSLRLLDQGDAEQLFELTERNREILNGVFEWPDYVTEVQHARTHIEDAKTQARDGIAWHLGIFRDGVLVGRVSLRRQDDSSEGEFGAWLDHEVRGGGVITKVGPMMLGFAFGELGFERIITRCLVENRPSALAALLCGFKANGYESGGLLFRGERRNIRHFCYLKEDYFGRLAA